MDKSLYYFDWLASKNDKHVDNQLKIFALRQLRLSENIDNETESVNSDVSVLSSNQGNEYEDGVSVQPQTIRQIVEQLNLNIPNRKRSYIGNMVALEFLRVYGRKPNREKVEGQMRNVFKSENEISFVKEFIQSMNVH